ncbi:MAG TPA: ABC transporter permease [Actinocrinis sp.]|jgi:simple sugar transport system permease protein|uniref:ABC transporter permease n=1 Tax=Actinocrinis sp. TaxID=1920516 RepID=UPI002DDCA2FF|nr:ABC transporter permease [Actinocrinis sp.]HEV3168907.1 ABC transporter permease [Actinocrinis sp.]
MTTDTTPEERAQEQEPLGGFGASLQNIFSAENSILVTVLAIVLALIVGAILMVVSDTSAMSKADYFFQSPGDFLSAAWHDISTGYSALFKGAIFDPKTVNGTPSQFFGPITGTLLDATPLIFGGLAVSLAFRGGLFNIGGQGQLIMGAIFAGYVGFAWHLPTGLHVIVAVIAGAIGGGLYGLLVGVLKAWRGAHEVIVTIMFNYAAFLFLGWLLNANGFHDPHVFGQAVSKPVDPNARLPHLFGDSVPTDISLVIAIAAAVVVSWFFRRSKLGFEVRALGFNPFAARTAGINVGRTRILTMALSGLLFGLVGVCQTLGTANANNNSLSPNIDANLGFTAITVALLGRNKPWGIVWAALLFGAFDAGAPIMQASAGIRVEIVSVIEALIVIFVAAPRLVQEIFRLRARRAAAATGGQA